MWSVKAILIQILSLQLALSAELTCNRHPELEYIQCELSEQVDGDEIVTVAVKNNVLIDESDVVITYKNLGLHLPHGIGDSFKNLVSLDVSTSTIAKIDRLCFKNMEKLNDLRLFYNNIEELPGDVFADLRQLEILNLAKNQLTQLPNELFASLLKLKILRLNENQLKTINADVFKHNLQLRELSLHRNMITRITFDFAALKNIVALDLSANAGSCNVKFDKKNGKETADISEAAGLIQKFCNH